MRKPLLTESDLLIGQASDIKAVICERCKGEGWVKATTITEPYAWGLTQCPICIGSGALAVPNEHKTTAIVFENKHLRWLGFWAAALIILAGYSLWCLLSNR